MKRLSRGKGKRSETRIIHLGPGAFFRAFNATYTADAGDWGITAVSLRSPDIRDKLKPQGNVYTAVSLGPEGMKPQVIEVLYDILVAPENPRKVLDAMVDPAVKIVSLTNTEKGYSHKPATVELR
jgi:fructuronate reductase